MGIGLLINDEHLTNAQKYDYYIWMEFIYRNLGDEEKANEYLEKAIATPDAPNYGGPLLTEEDQNNEGL